MTSGQTLHVMVRVPRHLRHLRVWIRLSRPQGRPVAFPGPAGTTYTERRERERSLGMFATDSDLAPRDARISRIPRRLALLSRENEGLMCLYAWRVRNGDENMTTNKHNAERDAGAILDTLRITRIKPRKSCGGSWVLGTIAGHRFEALVFPEHADSPDFELGDSRISKLWIRRIEDQVTVANFDRGWDVLPATPRATTIVDLLAAGLAEHVFGN